jgi:hypothetical protein
MAARTSEKPKYQTIDGKLVAQTPEGEIKIPLQIKTKLVRAARNVMNGQGDELDQLVVILEGIGDTATIEKLDELDFMTETMPLVQEFFRAFGQQQRANAGESSASSN